MQISLNHVRHFIVVAEELHFGRAAARLHIAQPPLSHQIRQLEKEMNVELFTRFNKKVKLTAAGEIFLTRSKQLLLDLDESVLQAQRAHRGETGTLVVGTIPAGMSDLFTFTLPTFRAKHPSVHLSIKSMDTATLISSLHHGEVDLAVVRMPISDPRIEVRGVVSDMLSVVLHRNHPMSERETLSLSDIASEPQIIFPRRFAPDYFEMLQNMFKGVGATLSVAHEAEDAQTHLGLISGGFGIGLFPSTSKLRYENVVSIPLRDPVVIISTGIGFLRGRETPLISDFLSIASQSANLHAQFAGGQTR